MKRVSIYNLYKIATSNSEPMLLDHSLASLLPFMDDYIENYKYYDNYIAKQYCEFYPTWNLQYCLNDKQVYSSFRSTVFTHLLTKKDSLQHMYNALKLSYEPIENYNRVETETITRTGTDTNRTEYGETVTKKNFGDQTTTDTYGKQTNVNTRDVYGFNSSEASKDSTETDEIGSKTDSRTESAREDTETTESRTDTLTNTKDLKDVRTNITHGNIGVTTSQQMLESEMKLRLTYSFYNMVFSDIIETLCNFYDAGFDAFEVAGKEDIEMSASTTGIGIDLQQTDSGVIINITEDGEVVDSATVYNGITPDLKIEDGNLYANYDKEG